MATTIEQHPLYDTLPVGQDVIFSVSNSNIVSTFTGVKIIAEVHISSGLPPNLATTDDLVGTFKTTPNNAGVGMFNFRPIIESFVNADNTSNAGAQYKGTPHSDQQFALHLVDKYSRNKESLRYLAIEFTTEYIDATGTRVLDNTQNNSEDYKVFNGFVKYTDDIQIVDDNFGFNPYAFQFALGARFLTNAPTTQYANINDYGTLGFLSSPITGAAASTTLTYMQINMFDDSGVVIGTPINVGNTFGNGGYTTWSAYALGQLMFFGCFPGNLQNWSTVFQAAVSTLSYYDVQAYNLAGTAISEKITIKINCPNTKGFEPIRLTWLNQWGAWDYYTFNMLSAKSISTKGSTYRQLEGTWNESAYRLDSFKGGKKAFRVNATEKIKMNTDFVNELESEWFEDLINSPEVYILEGYKTDVILSALNKYVTPVRLTTSSYTKKTIANDRLMQYTFEVEKTKTLRTQSV